MQNPMAIPTRHMERARASKVQLTLSCSPTSSYLQMPGTHYSVLSSTHSEDIELSDFSQQCSRVCNNMIFLFMHGTTTGGCFATYGFTWIAMQVLKKRILIPMRDGIKTIGGEGVLTLDIKTKCLQRMACWAKLAVNTVKAEYPSITLFMQFAVFKLGQEKMVGTAFGDADIDMLKRLATHFKADHARLIEQFLDYGIRAEIIFKTSSQKKKKSAWCWGEAIRQIATRKNDIQKLHPRDELLKVVAPYNAMVPSTSGVEQIFSKARNHFGEQRLGGTQERESAVIKIIVDYRPEEEDEVIQLAREHWTLLYGVPRSSPKQPRLDVGVPKQKQDKSEAGWLRKRRRMVDEAVAATDVTAIGDEMLTGWGESHDKEMRFIQDKIKKKRVEAFKQNTLIESDITEDLKNEVM
jgi:hypothetical protein